MLNKLQTSAVRSLTLALFEQGHDEVRWHDSPSEGPGVLYVHANRPRPENPSVMFRFSSDTENATVRAIVTEEEFQLASFNQNMAIWEFAELCNADERMATEIVDHGGFGSPWDVAATYHATQLTTAAGARSMLDDLGLRSQTIRECIRDVVAGASPSETYDRARALLIGLRPDCEILSSADERVPDATPESTADPLAQMLTSRELVESGSLVRMDPKVSTVDGRPGLCLRRVDFDDSPHSGPLVTGAVVPPYTSTTD
jgi:hypothetical protein